MSKKPGQRRKKPRNRQPTPGHPGGNPAVRPAAGGTAGRSAGRSANRVGNQVANPTTDRTPEQAQGNANLILWAGFGAVLLLFWYYHLLTLNQLRDLSGGLPMPDQLFGGYNAAYIDRLRAGMNADARGQLNYVHKTAGVLFPLFLSLTTLLTVALHVPRRWLRWALWSVPLAFAVVDLWENSAIDAVLAGPADARAVALASALTVTRWILLLATVLLALGTVVLAFLRTFRRKWAEAGLS